MALDWVALVGSVIVRAIWLPTLVGLAAVGALALPLLLISALRFIGELARQYRLGAGRPSLCPGPALHVLAFLAAGAVAALGRVAALAPQLGMTQRRLASVTVGPLTQTLTLLTVALFVDSSAGVAVGLDIPYRVGISAGGVTGWVN